MKKLFVKTACAAMLVGAVLAFASCGKAVDDAESKADDLLDGTHNDGIVTDDPDESHLDDLIDDMMPNGGMSGDGMRPGDDMTNDTDMMPDGMPDLAPGTNAPATGVEPDGDLGNEIRSRSNVIGRSMLSMIDRIHAQVPANVLPSIGGKSLDMEDREAMASHTGFSELEGASSVVVTEPLVTPGTYSLICVRCEDEEAVTRIKQYLYENGGKEMILQPEHSICVEMERDVFLISGTEDQTEAVYASLLSYAKEHGLTVGLKLEKI